jgi:excisionase family DNA binding protein
MNESGGVIQILLCLVFSALLNFGFLVMYPLATSVITSHAVASQSEKPSPTKAGGNGNLISVLVDLNETEEEKMEAKGEPRLLRAEEVVKLTGWSRAKVYAMAGSGELPALRSGRSVRIPLAALEKWIEQNTTGGTQ